MHYYFNHDDLHQTSFTHSLSSDFPWFPPLFLFFPLGFPWVFFPIASTSPSPRIGSPHRRAPSQRPRLRGSSAASCRSWCWWTPLGPSTKCGSRCWEAGELYAYDTYNICAYTCQCIHIQISIYIYIHIHTYKYIYIYIHIYIYTCLCVCWRYFVCIHTCAHANMYVYNIYIYIYMIYHIYIYICNNPVTPYSMILYMYDFDMIWHCFA